MSMFFRYRLLIITFLSFQIYYVFLFHHLYSFLYYMIIIFHPDCIPLQSPNL